MEMELGITIAKLVIQVRLAQDRPDNIKAFGELWFYTEGDSEPVFKVKGFTIRLKEFESGKKVLSVVFPAFPSPASKTGYQHSFITENQALYEDIIKLFLQGFEQLSEGRGEVKPEINIDEIDEQLSKGQDETGQKRLL